MKYCGGCGLRLLNTAEQAVDPTSTSPSTDSRFGALIGSDLLDRFKAAGLQATGQKRSVTILFVDLSGFTNLSQGIDPEELYEIVQQCSHIFANAVYRYEGMVDKFTGDGLMALFGAPIAHENNAELAIRAALDMQSELAQFSLTVRDRIGQDLQAHIGLNSGVVIVGGIGSNMMMNYTAIGDVVNRASRIMDKASSGTILVSERIYKHVRGTFELEAIPPLMLKGVNEPVQTYKVLGFRDVIGSGKLLDDLYSPMFGREAELNLLQQSLNLMMANQSGSLFAIQGEAGIGKSRLVSEFCEQINHLPITIMRGRSYVYRKAVTFWLLQDIITDILDIPAGERSSILHDKLEQTIDQFFSTEADDVLPYFEYLFSLQHKSPEKAKFLTYLPPNQLRTQLFRRIRDFIQLFSDNKPTILILEDFQWADQASVEFTNYLVDRLSNLPIMVLAIGRTFEDPAFTAYLQRNTSGSPSRIFDMSLHALKTEQTRQLVVHLADSAHLPHEFVDQIVTRSGGTPLFAEEMLRMLRDSGAMVKMDGKWKIQKNVPLTFMGNSDTLEGLILTRFDNLDPVSRTVLKTASVIGRTFTLELIVECLPSLPEDSINNAIEELFTKGFIFKDTTHGKEYVFRNLVISETIYSTQLKKDRREIHGMVGHAIEKLFAESLDEQVDLLARHYFWSGFKDKGLKYQALAGAKSLSKFSNIQAKEYFENAASLLPNVTHTDDQVLEIYIGLGDALSITGNYDEARSNFEKALKITIPHGHSKAVMSSSLLRRIGLTLDKQGQTDNALDKLSLAENILGDTQADEERAQILSDEGWIDFRRGRLEDAERALTKAEIYANASLNQDVISNIYNRLGGLFFEKNDIHKAREYTNRSLEQWENLGNLTGLARGYNNLALLEWKQGEWDTALINFSRSEEIQTKLDNIEGIVIVRTNIGLINMDKGEVKLAIRLINSARNLAIEIGHMSYIALTTLYIGKCHSIAHEWDQALRYFADAHEHLLVLDDPEYLLDVTLDTAQAQARQGKVSQATETLKTATKFFLGLEKELQENNQGRFEFISGEVAFASGDDQTAVEKYTLATTYLIGKENQLERARALLALCKALFQNGDSILAQQYCQECLETFEQLGAKLDHHQANLMRLKLASHR